MHLQLQFTSYTYTAHIIYYRREKFAYELNTTTQTATILYYIRADSVHKKKIDKIILLQCVADRMELFTWFFVPNWIIALRKFNFVSILPIDGNYTILRSNLNVPNVKITKSICCNDTLLFGLKYYRFLVCLVVVVYEKTEGKERKKEIDDPLRSRTLCIVNAICVYAYGSFWQHNTKWVSTYECASVNLEHKCQKQPTHFTHHFNTRRWNRSCQIVNAPTKIHTTY